MEREIPGALKDSDRKKLIKFGFKFPNHHYTIIKAKIPKKWSCIEKEEGDKESGYTTYFFYDANKKLKCVGYYGWSYFDGTYANYDFDLDKYKLPLHK